MAEVAAAAAAAGFKGEGEGGVIVKMEVWSVNRTEAGIPVLVVQTAN